MIEQRKNQRFELRLPFEILHQPNGSSLRGETRNVSSSGVLFAAEGDVGVGDPIEYFVKLPRTVGIHNEVGLRCVGKVLRGEAESTYAVTLERYEFVRTPIS